MKKKVLNKLLVLNKNTIANLDHGQMEHLKGGATVGCPSIPETCKWECNPTLDCSGSPCADTDHPICPGG